MALSRNSVLTTLKDHQPELAKFGVERIALFGSVVRNEATQESDVDLLVEFNRPIGLFEFIELQIYLEALLGTSVDLVTPDALRDEMRDEILSETVYA